ncbi:MAG TPA: glucose 1-dehydrogenase [Chitinophaga sp.]|uniref:SDR family NAD(P)-dependent oxidoreductase n=1 Tax=Chitinophaga sp. TaxID=1869181 RepID=UPI002F92E28F
MKTTSEPELSQSVVLVTGALTGIGRATAIAFAKEGANVVVSGRRDAEGQALAAELRELGVGAEYINADVRKEADVQNLVEQTVAKFGRLDVAVNNAGTEGIPGPVVEQTPETYEATFQTNVLGVLLSLKHELKVMVAQGHGSIINVSSVLGRQGAAGASVYTASKHAVEGLSRSAALEVASSGVRVNVVAPGPIETGMLNRFVGDNKEFKSGLLATVPAQRAGLPEEVAQTIVFLGTNKSLFLTGESIAVDGGKLA